MCAFVLFGVPDVIVIRCSKDSCICGDIYTDVTAPKALRHEQTMNKA